MISSLPFDHAIVRFACLQAKQQSLRLVFASVEMLARGRMPPDTAPLDDKGYPPSLSTKAGRLSFRRLGLPADEALAWYRDLTMLPDPMGPHAGTPLSHALLVDEPAWADDLWSALSVPIPPPILPGPLDDDRIDPFVGANRESVRVHRRLSVGDPAVDGLNGLPASERRGALEWLRLRVWVDFELYPELLGSAALVIPDPEVRTVHMRIDRDPDGNEALLAQVKWRGMPAGNLTLLAREERHGGLAWVQSLKVPENGTIRAPRPKPLCEIGWDLLHPERGVIASHQPTGFIRSIGVGANMQGREVRLISKDGRGKKAPEGVRSVRDAHREDWSTGAPLPPPGCMAEGRERRRIARARGTEFWLDDPTIARDKLWRLIGDARTDVMLVDPYADGQDLIDYGMATSGARVRLLTALRTAREAADTREPMPLEKGLAQMANAGKHAEARRTNAALHDRFLVLDAEVWLIGASLNGLGTQATMLIQLRHPQPVLERLEGIWAKPVTAS